MALVTQITPEPRFAVGDLVRVQGSGSLAPVSTRRGTDIYQVVARLREAGGQHRYRIKGGEDWHELEIQESELVHASKSQSR